MRVYLGADHAGYALKARLLAELAAAGHEPVDCGPPRYDPDDDYPAYCLLAATRTVADPGSLGIVVGGSGNGEAIAANKVRGARCALAFSAETARLAREHNDANLLSLGARMYAEDDAVAFAVAFAATRFSGEGRHRRRLAQVAAYERSGELPPRPEAGG